ncbi:MAG: hypothetical protein HQM08_29410 [Candidatus Riflebacteria bacterium]|nr:hypothetical protein [Candidatus Riflebacteria bacterium]
MQKALKIVQEYIDSGVKIISQQDIQIQTFVGVANIVKTRKKVFDISLAATSIDNLVSGLYTKNVDYFKEFDFLKIEDPLTEEV